MNPTNKYKTFKPISAQSKMGVFEKDSQNRLNQSLAQLYLSFVPNGYPFETLLEENKESVDELDPNPLLTLKMKNRISELIRQYIQKPLVPEWKHEPVCKISNQTLLNQVQISPSLLSSNTKESIVYLTQLYPHSSLIQFFSEKNPKKIDAVLKKIPICDIGTWKLFVDSKYTLFDRKWEQLQTELKKQQFSKNNHAYLDAYCLYLGSSLVENGISCFFPLLYGTFRIYDYQYFNHVKYDSYPFPVQLIFMQPLEGSLHQLVKNGWFLKETSASHSENSYLNCEKWMSCFAQIVFGLCLFQDFFHFVHNDFHSMNCMFENVDEKMHLYYLQRSTQIYYKVPTFGKRFKMIDFGHSSVFYEEEDGAQMIESEWLPSYLKNNPNYSIDLIRIVSSVVLEMRNHIKPQHIKDPVWPHLINFLSHVTTCEKDDRIYNIFEKYDECIQMIRLDYANRIIAEKKNDSTIPTALLNEIESEFYQKMKQCQIGELVQKPFLQTLNCKGGIPKENIIYFEMFKVDKSSIPSDQPIYLID